MSLSKSNQITPVALFVYNRTVCLNDTLNALKRNKIQKLYVFSDGPKDSESEKGVTDVRNIIKMIDWVDIEIIERNKNFGLSRSIKDGINYVLKQYEKIIVIEDDICVADDFFAYMQNCLENYRDDERIAGVTGVRYPFDRSVFNNYSCDIFFTHRFSSWGWGTWRRWWDTLETDIVSLRKLVKESSIDWSQGGYSMKYMATARLVGETHGVWDIDCAINLLAHRRYFVCPKFNLVRNTGFDNGTHTNPDNPDVVLHLEKHVSYNSAELVFPNDVTINRDINDAFINCFPVKHPSYRQWLTWNKLRLKRLARIVGK